MSKEVTKMTVEVEKVGSTEEFGDNGFTKRQLVGVIVDGEYTNKFEFEFVKDKTSLLDNVAPGDSVTVYFNIRCREWDGGNGVKYFTSLSGWKLDKEDSTDQKGKADPEKDDLPF